MPLHDSTALREFLRISLPGLRIDDVAAPSGQRVVYFCHFEYDGVDDDGQDVAPREWIDWGNVVLKVSEGVSANFIAYMQREIEILNRLDTDDFPRLLFNNVIYQDPVTEERLPFRRFVTIEQRIDAEPLNNVSDRYRSPEAVMDLLQKLVSCLRLLWELTPQLVHRDLKPANILIRANGSIAVIDLGIVREEGRAGVTNTAFDYGPCTPEYASPEQASNDKKNINFRSDIFALGIICYELLFGSNPFRDPDNLIDKTLSNVKTVVPESLHDLGLCTKEVSDLISRMMEKQPYKRFRRIDDLSQEIERIIGGL